MFSTQITSIESQRSYILAQIEELSRQEQALVQESLQYQALEDEAGSLLGAISSLKDKFANHADATSALFEEISKLFQPEEPPAEPEPQPEKWENLVEAESEEDLETNRYESAAEIAAALADTEALDLHLMAIASIFDTCSAIEIPGRVLFFIQNIPADFDHRILKYFPKSIRPEWDRQRTAYEHEMKASIFPETIDYTLHNAVESESNWVNLVEDEEFEEESEPALQENQSSKQMEVLDAIKEAEAVEKSFEVDVPQQEFKKGDWVEIYDGQVLEVLRLAQVGDATYFEVMHQGARTAFRSTDLKPATKPETSTTKSKTKKVKASKTTSADILKCQNWGEIRAIANGNPQILKDAATAAKTKSEKQLIEDLPQLIRQWQVDNRDFSDFDWMPAYLVQRVRMLLSAPGTAA